MRMIRAIVASAFVLLSACTAVTSPGRFSFEDEPTCLPEDPSDLVLVLHDFQEYEDERIQIVGSEANSLVFRGTLDGLDSDGVSQFDSDTSARFCLTVPDLRERHPGLTVHVFVDVDPNGMFQPTDDVGGELEPVWQAEFVDDVAEVYGTDPSETFDPLSSMPPGTFRLAMTNMNFHITGTQQLSAMVLEADTPIGFYRIHDIDDANPSFEINTILAPNTVYQLQFYADANMDGGYDPEGDHSWIREFTSNDAGDVDGTFDHTGTFEALTVF